LVALRGLTPAQLEEARRNYGNAIEQASKLIPFVRPPPSPEDPESMSESKRAQLEYWANVTNGLPDLMPAIDRAGEVMQARSRAGRIEDPKERAEAFLELEIAADPEEQKLLALYRKKAEAAEGRVNFDRNKHYANYKRAVLLRLGVPEESLSPSGDIQDASSFPRELRQRVGRVLQTIRKDWEEMVQKQEQAAVVEAQTQYLQRTRARISEEIDRLRTEHIPGLFNELREIEEMRQTAKYGYDPEIANERERALNKELLQAQARVEDLRGRLLDFSANRTGPVKKAKPGDTLSGIALLGTMARLAGIW
jgi:hypothetical protein